MRSVLILVTVLCSALLVAAIHPHHCTASHDSAILSRCSESKVDARLPPTLNPTAELSRRWVAPPTEWMYGNWKVTYSSHPLFLPLLNMQGDRSPVFPQSSKTPGKHNGLFTYQLANSSDTIYSLFGTDMPRRSSNKTLGPEWDAVYDWTAGGSLSSIMTTSEILAWGYDSCGAAYTATYATVTSMPNLSPSLIISSRSDKGPSEDTLHAVFEALSCLGNAELAGSVNRTRKHVQNGARDCLPPYECDTACVNNLGVYNA
ncbi:hypothetical protein K474DRAFT_1674933 [Panus rudis PR-1116 ss-1]|nr:hypothetical protein K474DRAFT_1674933 [Panus rudis PR-1116 ss-1]